jgi:hypothetical protein
MTDWMDRHGFTNSEADEKELAHGKGRRETHCAARDKQIAPTVRQSRRGNVGLEHVTHIPHVAILEERLSEADRHISELKKALEAAKTTQVPEAVPIAAVQSLQASRSEVDAAKIAARRQIAGSGQAVTAGVAQSQRAESAKGVQSKAGQKQAIGAKDTSVQDQEVMIAVPDDQANPVIESAQNMAGAFSFNHLAGHLSPGVSTFIDHGHLRLDVENGTKSSQQQAHLSKLTRMWLNINHLSPFGKHAADVQRADPELHELPQQDTELHELPQQDSELHELPQQDSELHELPQQDTELHELPQQDTELHALPQQDTELHELPQQDTYVMLLDTERPCSP